MEEEREAFLIHDVGTLGEIDHFDFATDDGLKRRFQVATGNQASCGASDNQDAEGCAFGSNLVVKTIIRTCEDVGLIAELPVHAMVLASILLPHIDTCGPLKSHHDDRDGDDHEGKLDPDAPRFARAFFGCHARRACR